MASPQHQHTNALTNNTNHHIQILGNHPASPVFLDIQSDSFMHARGTNLLFADCDYEHEYSTEIASSSTSSSSSSSLTATAPLTTMVDSATDFLYSTHQNQNQNQNQNHSQLHHGHGHIRSSSRPEFSNEHFAAMAPAYMMAMSRSFSEGQLSMCDDNSPASSSSSSFLSAQASLNQATGATRDLDLCQSPMVYGSQNVYEDEYYLNQQQQQQHQQQHGHHGHHQHHQHQHHHSHSCSTSSFSTLSEDSSSMSPRSPFSQAVSLSNSNNSIVSSAYPLARTLSEPMIPLFQSEAMVPTTSSTSCLSPSSSSLSCDSIGSTNNASSSTSLDGAIKPTPKRSRGRRVSSHPDNSGCKVFTCRYDDCGKIFKRSEHLKRHVRSIHTMDK
ncbi:hypothetical protein BGZ94_005180, partial [Podila epigama]